MEIRIATSNEYAEIGQLMSSVYSSLEGFPSRDEQPDYYALFDNLGLLAGNNYTDLITARTQSGELLGSVVYFADMQHYGAAGAVTQMKNASALRLLAVLPAARGGGVGRALTDKCIELARSKAHSQVILHTTVYMKAAWGLYEKMGFQRYEELDFLQGEMSVFGFRLKL